jgi:hypothetical protein
MDNTLKDWAMKPTQDQTLQNAITHFTRANKYQRENRAYLKETMAANQATTTKALKPLSHVPGRTMAGFHHCWLHRICINEGINCRSPVHYTKSQRIQLKIVNRIL